MSSQRLSIEYQSIKSIVLDSHNPRLHTKKQIGQLAKSIATFGLNVPILVDAALRVIAGHGRVQACTRLGITEIPVIRIEHLTENQKRAFQIADNRLCENSEWSEALLGQQLKFLSESDIDFSLEVTGFEMSEIDLLVEGLEAPIEKDDPADLINVSEARPPVTRLGDCWVLGRHRVLCADAQLSSAYAGLMRGVKAQMVFADPPFNVRIDGYVNGFGKIHHREFAMASGEMTVAEFTSFLATVTTHLARNSTNGSLHYVCMDWRHSAELLSATQSVFTEFKNLCVWVKDTAGQGSLYRSQHELVFVFKNGKKPHRNNIQLGQHGRYRTNVWRYSRPNSMTQRQSEDNITNLHPTIKPVQLVADAILDCTVRGDVVLDPFLGSGTTLIAAERTGRTCYGMELDPGYVDTIVRRWRESTGQSAVNESTGQTFEEVQEDSPEVADVTRR